MTGPAGGSGLEPGGLAPDLYDMSPQQLRRHAHHVADWIADYVERVGELPVFPDIAPGDLRARLPPLPEKGDPFGEILADVDTLVVPATTHWNHPRFHAYFAVTGSGPGILAEAVAAALNVNGMVWRSGPAVTELEEHVLAHLADALGLPEGLTGAINDTASTSTLYALAAARHAALPGSTDSGLAGGPVGRVYASEQAHSSVDKAVLTLGMGRDGVVHVPTDAGLRMDPDALRRAIAEDRAAGRVPVAVVATLGTTSTTAVDPVGDIAEIAEEAGVWLHVDAAYGGPLALLPEWRDRFAGWERADSVVVNPHKWLFTPIDCSVLWVRGADRLRGAFALTPEYLRTTEGHDATNLMDFGVALGRRFRALKLWFVLRWFGLEGIRRRLRHHLHLAQELAGSIGATPGWAVHTPGTMALIVFRATLDDGSVDEENELNHRILERVARSGEALLSHTGLDGTVWLRLAVGNLRTTPDDLARSWSAVLDARAGSE
jgi:aromatic-L-amino-acid decarboxylase